MLATPDSTSKPAAVSLSINSADDRCSCRPSSANSQIALLTALSCGSRRTTASKAVCLESRSGGGWSACMREVGAMPTNANSATHRQMVCGFMAECPGVFDQRVEHWTVPDQARQADRTAGGLWAKPPHFAMAFSRTHGPLATAVRGRLYSRRAIGVGVCFLLARMVANGRTEDAATKDAESKDTASKAARTRRQSVVELATGPERNLSGD